ncbi:hypothetical protein B6S12_03400 [Helicobacter valdiviensis]|uniref:Autotransporter domain-containing protein n=1 Tax=Helicobacter valdiviensis TaxID=1458358 RepID=A0A2W6MX37_9HELI|nr:autotransporter outer membrane beta-barrel domain-containing protein [Helicobacter valdiviensis]PZT48529.1 hypothetical protein B6S12_03400 [Helicobacter valdiviensis]
MLEGSNGAISANINNSGFITTTGHAAININKNSIVKELKNNGSLQGQNGIALWNGGNIESLNNYGTIKGTSGKGLSVETKVDIEQIVNSGEIIGKDNAIELHEQAKVDRIENSGTILSSSSNGMYVRGDVGEINNKQGGRIHGAESGLSIIRLNDYKINIEKVINEGDIVGVAGNGIELQGLVNEEVLGELDNRGNIEGKQNGIYLGAFFGKHAKVGEIKNEGNIKGGVNGIALMTNKELATLANSIEKIDNKGFIVGESGAGLFLQNQYQKILNTITLEGSNTLMAGGEAGIINNGTIGSDQKDNEDTIILKEGAIISSIVSSANNLYLNTANPAILNEKSGKIQGNISLESGSKLIGGIYNKGTISGDIKTSGKDTQILGEINNEGSINGIKNGNGAFIEAITNNGMITNGVMNNATIGEITNNKTLKITNTKENNDEGGFIGAIANNGAMEIDNASEIGSLTNNKEGSLSLKNQEKGIIGSFTNEGELTSLENQGVIKDFENQGSLERLSNDGKLELNNAKGEIKQGIVNTGELTFANYAYNSPSLRESGTNITQGFVGKTSNGYHFENNGDSAKLKISGWYFNAPEFNSKEERLNNSILAGGTNIGGISADKIYVSGADMNVIYDSNTFFSDKDGNAIGGSINNGMGIDADDIYSVDELFKFVNVGEKGKYTAYLLTDELSGKTLAKSIIQSSRMRQINTSNILKEVNSKNFRTNFRDIQRLEQSTKDIAISSSSFVDKQEKNTEENYNTYDILREFEEIFLPQKDVNKDIYSFLVPYYNYSSLNLEEGLGRLKVKTSGIIGGAQTKLDNEYGILGFYLGYETADKEQQRQRLTMDDTVYYGGLTYHHTFLRDGIKEFYFSTTTRVDYTKSKVEKTYQNGVAKINTKVETYGYGLESKVGANLFNIGDISILSPEMGLSYMGISSKDFSLNHLGGTKEHYYATQVNFVDFIASIKYQRAWNDRLRFNGSVGALINLYNDAKGEMRVNRTYLSSDVKTSGAYGFSTLGATYNIANNTDLSLNYGVVLGDAKSYSHNIYLKLGIWW